MTDFTRYASRTRDIQDLVERGVWGTRTDVQGGGSIMSVRGTGTVDEELPIVNFGYSFNAAADADHEVIMVSLGSDVDMKVALPTIGRQFQHQWTQGTGGIQYHEDANRRIEFNGTETILHDGQFIVGSNRELTITVDGANITLTTGGDLTVQANNVEITSNTLTHNGTNIGQTHVHGGVQAGPNNTGTPI